MKIINNSMYVKVDNRERCPWSTFSLPTIKGTLNVGDYSIVVGDPDTENFKDYSTEISLERKELGDICNCLGKDRDRFVRMLERSISLRYFGIIVESDFKTIAKGQYKSLIKSNSVIGSLLTFSIRYGAHIFFAGDRRNGARICEELLIKFVKEKLLEAVESE